MTDNRISKIEIVGIKDDAYSHDELVEANVRFAIEGGLRDVFNETTWTRAYNNNDVSFKMKYGIKLVSGGFRKKELGRTIDTYRKASIFWTRNPKLVNPMKEKKIWVQVAKNFEPFIRLTEEEVKQELFDFDEKFVFRASDLGSGRHKVGVEAFASWQKHDYTEPDSIKTSSRETEIIVN